jgi:hypothetical protein
MLFRSVKNARMGGQHAHAKYPTKLSTCHCTWYLITRNELALLRPLSSWVPCFKWLHRHCKSEIVCDLQLHNYMAENEQYQNQHVVLLWSELCICLCLLLLLLLLLLQIRTQPHLGCCLAAATAVAAAIFMHLRTNSATSYTSRQHMRSCNDVKGNCANRPRLTTAVAGREKSRWASSSTGTSMIHLCHYTWSLVPFNR